MINNFKNLKNKNGDHDETVSVSKRSTTNEIMKVTERVINLKSPNMFNIVNNL